MYWKRDMVKTGCKRPNPSLWALWALVTIANPKGKEFIIAHFSRSLRMHIPVGFQAFK